MSIKKELLSKLSLEDLKRLASKKGISFSLNELQKQYYAEWPEKERIVDLMNDINDLSVREIEDHLKAIRR